MFTALQHSKVDLPVVAKHHKNLFSIAKMKIEVFLVEIDVIRIDELSLLFSHLLFKVGYVFLKLMSTQTTPWISFTPPFSEYKMYVSQNAL